MIISVQWILQTNVDLNSFKVFVFIQKDEMDTNYLLSKVTKNDNKAEIFMLKKNVHWNKIVMKFSFILANVLALGL